MQPDTRKDAGAEPDEDAPVRPRGWLVAAGVTGATAGGFFAIAILLPVTAPYLAPAGVFLGVATGALLMRRARDRELLAALAPDDGETSADRAFELRDIAEHYRRAADDRRRALAASDAKSRFLTTVSHELKTPLSGVLGLAEVLLDTPLTPEQETFARAVRNSGELMLGLVDDLLDFAKIEAGRFELAPMPTALEAAVEDIAELLFSRADAKGLDLAASVDPALPATVLVDAARLRQVLINLAGNAVRYTVAGGVVLTVGPDPADPGRIRFAVEDTGPGVPADLADRIFADAEPIGLDHDPRVGGSGLGLAIARRIVRQMGSEIMLAERPGGGSVFSFALSLPIVQTAAAESRTLGGKRVLLVAPAGLAPAAVARQLGFAGADARITASASHAAALSGAAAAAGEPYDFLLLDARVAVDAAGALATIRDAAGSRIPAAILVPPGRRKDAAALEREGFDAYLVRPVRRRSLLRIAERLAAGEKGFGVDPSDQRQAPRQRPAGVTGLRVLLADDDAVNALLMRSMLLRQGHDVTEVHDGAAALDAAHAERFDLVLLDLVLPGLDGIAVAKAIRRHERDMGLAPATLMAITADGRPESEEAALAVGFDRFLRKPLTPAMLRALIDTARAIAAAA